MKKFTLEVLFQIIGIGSASGLVYKDNSLFIVSDNASVLYEYNIENKNLDRHPLLENNPETPTENIPKKQKPDFEAITSFGEDCYIFGSGSTENRKKMIHFDASQKQKISETDVSALYDVMQSFGEITPEDFNIEGAVYTGEEWFLFNRGNGKSSKNGIFTIGGKNLSEEFSVLYNSYKLPKIRKCRVPSLMRFVLTTKFIFWPLWKTQNQHTKMELSWEPLSEDWTSKK